MTITCLKVSTDHCGYQVSDFRDDETGKHFNGYATPKGWINAFGALGIAYANKIEKKYPIEYFYLLREGDSCPHYAKPTYNRELDKVEFLGREYDL